MDSNKTNLHPLLENVHPVILKDGQSYSDYIKSLDRPKWYWVLLGRIVVLSIVGFSLWYYQFESLIVVTVLFILVVPMEKLFPRHKGQKVRRPKWKLDVAYALSQPFLNIFGVIFGFLSRTCHNFNANSRNSFGIFKDKIYSMQIPHSYCTVLFCISGIVCS